LQDKLWVFDVAAVATKIFVLNVGSADVALELDFDELCLSDETQHF
jgi:hypothetical protein